MQTAAAYRDETPIMDINTTPLIDVLLVLLIMFIITIPLQSHAVKLDLPGGPPPPSAQLRPLSNRVVITTGGQILWNAVPVSTAELRYNLEVTQQMTPTPELHLQPEPQARYELVDQVLAITKQAQVEKMGFVGNERYAAF